MRTAASRVGELLHVELGGPGLRVHEAKPRDVDILVGEGLQVDLVNVQAGDEVVVVVCQQLDLVGLAQDQLNLVVGAVQHDPRLLCKRVSVWM